MSTSEFSSIQNAQFKALALKANLVAIPLILLTGFHMSQLAFPEATPHIAGTLAGDAIVSVIIPDIFGFTAAVFMISASRAYIQIVKTKGNDIPLLIIGNNKMWEALNCLSITLILYAIRFVILPLIGFQVVPEG